MHGYNKTDNIVTVHGDNKTDNNVTVHGYNKTDGIVTVHGYNKTDGIVTVHGYNKTDGIVTVHGNTATVSGRLKKFLRLSRLCLFKITDLLHFLFNSAAYYFYTVYTYCSPVALIA